MKKPTPISERCLCGAEATHNIEIDIVLWEGFTGTATVPVCREHGMGATFADARVMVISTHEPYTMEVVIFPPGKGEIANHPKEGVVFGCPVCGDLCFVLTFAADAESGRLSPRFVCPHCAARIWLHVALDCVERPTYH